MNNQDVKVEQIKVFKCFSIVSFVLLLSSLFCFFIGYINIPLGYILGYIISSINHFLIYKLSQDIFLKSNVKRASSFNYLIRIGLFALGMTLCLLLDHYHIKVLSWISYLLAFMFQKICLVIVMKKKSV